jgi:hypothetical protein
MSEDAKGQPPPSAFDLEALLNKWTQRAFPAWYATHFAEEMLIDDLGELNAHHFTAKKWMSLSNICQNAAQSLHATGEPWHSLAELFEHLIRYTQQKRKFALSQLLFVKESQYTDSFHHMLEYAQVHSVDIPHSTAEDFDRTIQEAFPEAKSPFPVVFREWDGRMYYNNTTEPTLLGALLLQCKTGRDFKLSCQLTTESVDHRAIEMMRTRYAVLLIKRDSAYILNYLIRSAGLYVTIAEYEWQRSDLCLLIVKRNHYKAQQILHSIIARRSPTKVLDIGHFFATHRYPLKVA